MVLTSLSSFLSHRTPGISLVNFVGEEVRVVDYGSSVSPPVIEMIVGSLTCREEEGELVARHDHLLGGCVNISIRGETNVVIYCKQTRTLVHHTIPFQ